MASELILIIEDNEVNRVLVRDMLRFNGYQTCLKIENAAPPFIIRCDNLAHKIIGHKFGWGREARSQTV